MNEHVALDGEHYVDFEMFSVLAALCVHGLSHVLTGLSCFVRNSGRPDCLPNKQVFSTFLYFSDLQ